MTQDPVAFFSSDTVPDATNYAADEGNDAILFIAEEYSFHFLSASFGFYSYTMITVNEAFVDAIATTSMQNYLAGLEGKRG